MHLNFNGQLTRRLQRWRAEGYPISMSGARRPRWLALVRQMAGWLTLALVLALWQIAVWLNALPPALLPSPASVWAKFVQVFNDGRWWLHTSTTLQEVLLGLALGVTVAVVLGYFIARVPLLEDLLSPVIITLQSTPVVAYAPLLIIWFGSGITSKVVICALIVFFPMLMNTIVGIRNVPDDLRDLLRVSQAGRWQTLVKLEIPAALPVLLTGLKTAATLSVIGAVVGEFINASAGVGFMINVARNQFDTPLVYVGVITLAVMARALYGLVSLAERRLLAWQRYG